jgi:ribonuclease G
VSRRIAAPGERARLKAVLDGLREGDEGFIARTACEGVADTDLASDIEFLRDLFRAIGERAASAKAPSLLHADLDLPLRATRDLVTPDTKRIEVDDAEDLARIRDFLGRFLPGATERVLSYDGRTPLFEARGVEKQLGRALARRVSLDSGGYIVIDRTEALTAIDVNTGSFVGSQDLESTILQTNLEAAREVVRQLRLRDIGGLIVVDFIDMTDGGHRAQVEAAFSEALADDRARTSVLPISEFGLLQVTRRRQREDLGAQLLVACPSCAGNGTVRSPETLAYSLLREMRRNGNAARVGEELLLRAAPAVLDFVFGYEKPAFRKLESEIGAPVRVVPDPQVGPDGFVMSWRKLPAERA